MTKSPPLRPKRVLAIILGASEWPEFSTLDANLAFKNSAEGFRNYLKDTLDVPKDNIFWLFDTDLAHTDVDKAMRKFLGERGKELGPPDGDDPSRGEVILYFTGHGRTATSDGKFQFILRSTSSENTENSAYPMRDLASSLNDKALSFRRWIFLDCCCSGKAHPDLMPLEDVSRAMQKEAAEILLPRKGTALLAACAADTVAIASKTKSFTMFSGALLEVLGKGDKDLGKYLSLEEIRNFIEVKNQEEYLDKAVKSILSVPDESHGNIAKIPFFPNPAARAVGKGANVKVIQDRLDHLAREQAALANAFRDFDVSLRGQVTSMLDHFSWQLTDLENCQEDFIEQASRLAGKEDVEICHIGLDLFKTHSKMVAMLEKKFAIKTASLKLLVVTSEKRRIKRVPPSVDKMTKRVRPAVKELTDSLTNVLDQQYQERGQQLSVEIRSYTELPTIHGFNLKEGQRHVATYYSFCRWKGNDLDWGPNGYRRICGEPSNPYLKDMMEIFEGTFSHLWSNSKSIFKRTIGVGGNVSPRKRER